MPVSSMKPPAALVWLMSRGAPQPERLVRMPLFRRRTRNAGLHNTSLDAGEITIRVVRASSQSTVTVTGRVTVDSSPHLRSVLLQLLRRGAGPVVVIDLSGVSYLDMSGLATLLEALKAARRTLGDAPRARDDRPEQDARGNRGTGQDFSGRGLGGGVPMTFLEQVGRSAIGYAEDAGALTIQFWTVLRKLPRVLPVVGKRRRWRSAVQQMFAIGASALPMAGIMSLCTGFILALQSASELRRFGALQFVVDLVAIGFTRELGPLITALAVSGRSASAISAEIGTMVVTEEVDALRVMGLDPVEFTLAPKYLAALITLPCLTILSTLCGIFAGYLFLAFSIDMSLRVYFQAVAEAILLRDIALHARQERGVRDHHRPRWLPGRPAGARRSRSRWPFHNHRGGEIDFPRDPRGPRRHGDLLPDGMECRPMTNPSAANTGDPVISIRDVSMSYGSRRVLDRVDLDVYRGEILVLLGGSGSGKTTLLKHVLGLAKPDTGSIRINGVDITSCSPSELAAVRRRIGVAFQASSAVQFLVRCGQRCPAVAGADAARRFHDQADGLDEAEGGRPVGRGQALPSRAFGRHAETGGRSARDGAGSGDPDL